MHIVIYTATKEWSKVRSNIIPTRLVAPTHQIDVNHRWHSWIATFGHRLLRPLRLQHQLTLQLQDATLLTSACRKQQQLPEPWVQEQCTVALLNTLNDAAHSMRRGRGVRSPGS